MPRFPFLSAGCSLLALAAAASTIPLQAQTPGERFPLTGAVVAAALNRTGLAVVATQIDLPSPLSAATKEPQLRVTMADLLPDGRLRVRLACQQTGDCMPFLATVRLPSAPESLTAMANLQKTVKTASTPIHPAATGHLLAGQHATLLMEDNRMRIALEVISIDSGVPGSEVRVSSLDRKQTFRAVVVDAGTVRGTLP